MVATAAEDYPEAARTSAELAKHKAITLGQCMPVDGETESAGTEVQDASLRDAGTHDPVTAHPNLVKSLPRRSTASCPLV